MSYMHLVDLVKENNLIKIHGVPISDFTFVLSHSDLFFFLFFSVVHRIFSTYSVYCIVIPVTVSVLQGKTVLSFPFLCSFVPFLHSFSTLFLPYPFLLCPTNPHSSARRIYFGSSSVTVLQQIIAESFTGICCYL